MKERYCALAIGAIFLLLGIAGFIPSLVSLPARAEAIVPYEPSDATFHAGYGYLFGLFPINYLHNAVHLAVGILGVASFTSLSGARLYNRAFGIAYLLIGFLGVIPHVNTTFGLMPIYGNNVWFNGITGGAAAYFGFILPTGSKPEETASTSPSR